MERIRTFILYRLPALFFMGLIFYSSSGPSPDPTGGRIPDYVLHAGGYALLYLLLFLAVHGGTKPVPGRGGHWLPLLLTVLYGVTDEMHQSLIPTRICSVLDVLADAAGAAIAAWAVSWRWPASRSTAETRR